MNFKRNTGKRRSACRANVFFFALPLFFSRFTAFANWCTQGCSKMILSSYLSRAKAEKWVKISKHTHVNHLKPKKHHWIKRNKRLFNRIKFLEFFMNFQLSNVFVTFSPRTRGNPGTPSFPACGVTNNAKYLVSYHCVVCKSGKSRKRVNNTGKHRTRLKCKILKMKKLSY